jgi:hypothetical protein
MTETRDWSDMQTLSARLLEDRTGQDVAAWNKRIKAQKPKDEKTLRAWLKKQGVTGYAQTMLVHETFGYPDYLVASAKALIDGQYAGRPALRPIYEAVIEAAGGLGQVTLQARKTYVALVGPRRTFARIQSGKTHVAVALRLEMQRPGARLLPSKIHETMPVQLSLSSVEDLDAEALDWLQKAYAENA